MADAAGIGGEAFASSTNMKDTDAITAYFPMGYKKKVMWSCSFLAKVQLIFFL
jgi:hypothetical protein